MHDELLRDANLKKTQHTVTTMCCKYLCMYIDNLITPLFSSSFALSHSLPYLFLSFFPLTIGSRMRTTPTQKNSPLSSESASFILEAGSSVYRKVRNCFQEGCQILNQLLDMATGESKKEEERLIKNETNIGSLPDAELKEDDRCLQ